ncbi:MAG TPA: Rrf2 family transcriptional regulator [Patescibacteria group bacterium]|nr:Rrf2 family transcriptional regulator [Patescibacteria group bacterium]
MKLSTRGRYGVAVVYDLALHYGQGHVSLKSIGERQGISDGYLHQLIGALRQAGFVKSVRGSQGGYTLTQDPTCISVGDVVRVMEGPIAPVECLLAAADEHNSYCDRAGFCPRRGVWAKLQVAMNETLDKITFQDMCKSAPPTERQ